MNAEQKLIFDVLLSNDEELNPNTYINVEDKHHVRYLMMKYLARKIIKAFPQIEKKPVKIEVYKYNQPHGKEEYGIKLLQGFETELKRLQWIEERYVEVYQ